MENTNHKPRGSVKDQIKRLYLNTKMPMAQIARTVGRSRGYVGAVLSDSRRAGENIPYRNNISEDGIKKMREAMAANRSNNQKVVAFPTAKSGYQALKRKYLELQAEHNRLQAQYNELNDWYGIRTAERDQMVQELMEWRDGKRRLAVAPEPDLYRSEPPRIYEFDPAPHIHIDTRSKWQRWVDSLIWWLPTWR